MRTNQRCLPALFTLNQKHSPYVGDSENNVASLMAVWFKSYKQITTKLKNLILTLCFYYNGIHLYTSKCTLLPALNYMYHTEYSECPNGKVHTPLNATVRHLRSSV